MLGNSSYCKVLDDDTDETSNKDFETILSNAVKSSIKSLDQDVQQVKHAFGEEKKALRNKAQNMMDLVHQVGRALNSETEETSRKYGELSEHLQEVVQNTSEQFAEVRQNTTQKFADVMQNTAEQFAEIRQNTTRQFAELSARLEMVNNMTVILQSLTVQIKENERSIARASNAIEAVNKKITEKDADIKRVLAQMDNKVAALSNFEVRLVYQGKIGVSKGRLEVFHAGSWGTVCDDDFDNVDAAVLCRSLGYRHGEAKGEAYYGEGSGPIWKDDVICAGSESSLFECPSNDFGTHNCYHHEDVGVVCSG